MPLFSKSPDADFFYVAINGNEADPLVEIAPRSHERGYETLDLKRIVNIPGT
jgi:hypothetical protein